MLKDMSCCHDTSSVPHHVLHGSEDLRVCQQQQLWWIIISEVFFQQVRELRHKLVILARIRKSPESQASVLHTDNKGSVWNSNLWLITYESQREPSGRRDTTTLLQMVLSFIYWSPPECFFVCLFLRVRELGISRCPISNLKLSFSLLFLFIFGLELKVACKLHWSKQATNELKMGDDGN